MWRRHSCLPRRRLVSARPDPKWESLPCQTLRSPVPDFRRRLPHARYPPPGKRNAGAAFAWMDRYRDSTRSGPIDLAPEPIADMVMECVHRGVRLGPKISPWSSAWNRAGSAETSLGAADTSVCATPAKSRELILTPMLRTSASAPQLVAFRCPAFFAGQQLRGATLQWAIPPSRAGRLAVLPVPRKPV
jgi:hypothetical protein